MDRITKVDKIFQKIAGMLPKPLKEDTLEDKNSQFFANADGTMILSTDESEIEALANLFDQLYDQGTCTTGYYDPEEDADDDCEDEYTGFYYVSIG